MEKGIRYYSIFVKIRYWLANSELTLENLKALSLSMAKGQEAGFLRTSCPESTALLTGANNITINAAEPQTTDTV